MTPGRFTTEELQPEELTRTMDLREPRARRATFLRFYESHLKHRSHPGCVYFLFPEVIAHGDLDVEQRLWFAFINGNTQNPVTSWLIFREFPELAWLDEFKLEAWFQANYERLAFDTDRRYHKKHFLTCVANYRALLAGQTQAAFFAQVGRFSTTTSSEQRFRALWTFCLKHFVYFGRLSTFSYLEYLRIMGLPIQPDELFLDDLQGSKSHRNGLSKVLGRDDLDWHDSNPSFDGKYSPAMMSWLKREGELLLMDARCRFEGEPFIGDVNYFTLESALCTYKSWHRPNRRYANVYADMLVERIQKAELAWGEKLNLFWDARATELPRPLLLEHNPHDPGVVPEKQNHYRATGRPVMLGYDWPELMSAFDERVQYLQRAPG